jgi:hypothetical protein
MNQKHTDRMTTFDEYKIIAERVTGEVSIREHSQYNKLDADDVIVESGIRARLYGTIHKLLVMKKDCKVFLHGTLHGRIADEGGRLYHFEE